MKISFWFLVLSICIALIACGNSNQINGKSMKTAHKSVAFIKEHLPANQRVEFEVAYWGLRNQIKDDAEFLKTIDNKTSTDIVELGKASFAKNKAAGVAEVVDYDNWDQMIAKQIEQRTEQDRSAVDTKDKKGYPRVDYKMHAM
ncbi:hypothetical protein [Methylomonas sp. UP202]|uniref:hypothetical protein n=1 Tax=Methylomonas sp. UP202 TaxID=3040943 RepID=UPI00247AF7EE|nr:hypothetical protein [Methylomonas sp. UP202]WGS85097.1 hypothetical protein QC632_18895 [Methylomonas sp. UP202]